MENLSDESKDIAIRSMNALANAHKNKQNKCRRGRFVKTRDGKIGVYFSSEVTDDNKVLVYLEDGSKRICRPENLEFTGYFD